MSEMSRGALVQDFGEWLGPACDRFSPSQRSAHLDTAALELSRVKPTVKNGRLTVVAEQTDYPAPADLLAPMGSRWGFASLRDYRPWESRYPQHLPALLAERDDADALVLILTPAPTAEQVAWYGSEYRYRYKIRHVIADQAADTTVPEHQRALLLQRGHQGALHALAAGQVHAPVSLGGGGYSAPRNGHPAALAEQILNDWHRRILN